MPANHISSASSIVLKEAHFVKHGNLKEMENERISLLLCYFYHTNKGTKGISSKTFARVCNGTSFHTFLTEHYIIIMRKSQEPRKFLS